MNSSSADSDSRASPRSIWVFTPSRTAPEDLEAILVQRHDLLKDTVERIRESALTANKHHLLFVGPRGSGKTHLVTLIVSRVSADAEAVLHLRLAWLNEDETCTSLLELLIKIHVALEKRYPEEFRAEDLSEAYENKPTAALELVKARLLAGLGSRTLVMVAENLDALFESMGDQGQKQFRAFIQEHPRFAIVGTAQRLVEGLSDRAKPFFGFFQTEHLKPLTVEAAATLLQNIATRQGKTEVTAFLATSRGRSRVRALHHLSGGNHRIYIVLSQFITQESLDTLIGPFLKMVDELTPYYQERVRWLPPLQRKIVELLCTSEGTVPVKEIAKKLFSSPQTISSQLQDLREKGYVESNQRGRESLYEVSEPLMRICVEVKENQNTQPLRLLVDFLRVWYDDVELKRRLGLCLPESYSHHYLSAAVQRNEAEGNLRMRMLVEELWGDEFDAIDSGGWKQLEARLPEEILLAVQCEKSGDLDAAINHLNEVIDTTSIAETKALGLFARGSYLAKKGEDEVACAAYTQIIAMKDVTSELVAQVYYNRATLHFGHERYNETIADFTDFIRLNNSENPQENNAQITIAMCLRGCARFQVKHFAEAITDLTGYLQRTAEVSDLVAIILQIRGKCFFHKGNLEFAKEDFSRIIELPRMPLEQVAEAFFNRGVIYGQLDDKAAEIADYSRVIDLPGAPSNQVADALFNRGITHGQHGDNEAAIADYTRIIDLPGASSHRVTAALLNRGIMQFHTGQKHAARESLKSLILFLGAPAKHVMTAHLSLAELDFSDGCWSEGFGALEFALSLDSREASPCLEAPVNLIGVLFSAGLSQEGRHNQATRLYAIYTRHGGLAVLGEALVKHLGKLIQAEPRPASDNLDQWLVAWEQAAGDTPEFRLPLRLLRTGIEYLKSGDDPGVLLSLTAPERSLLRQALGLETGEAG